MLMGAMRVNIPTVFVSGGPMAAGIAEQQSGGDLPAHLGAATKKTDLISVFKRRGRTSGRQDHRSGPEETRTERLPTCGSCSGMFTANSMNCLCEALGMACPATAPLLAVSKERETLYLRAARAILKLVEHDIKRATSPRSRHSTMRWRSTVAMGGSTNTVLHTLAIAREAGIPYDIARIDAVSRRVPCLCKVSPSSNYHVQDVHRAGGIHTILGELKRMGALTTTCKTVTGKSLGEKHRRVGCPLGEVHFVGQNGPRLRRLGVGARTRTTSSGPPRVPPAQSHPETDAVLSRR